MSMMVNPDYCLKQQCGAIPRIAGEPCTIDCIEAGYAGFRSPNDPLCAPYVNEMVAQGTLPPPPYTPGPITMPDNAILHPAAMPSATTATMPQLPATVAMASPPVQPYLTPTSLNQRMPSIVDQTPYQVTEPVCGGFSAWVEDNPLLAALGLGLLAVAVFSNGRGK